MKGSEEHSYATMTKAEEIINAAKKIMKNRNLANAREKRVKKLEWIKNNLMN
jgi:hypothetical protein